MLLLIEKTKGGTVVHTPVCEKTEDRTVTKVKNGEGKDDFYEVVTFTPRFETEAEAADRAVAHFAKQGRTLTVVDAPDFRTRELRDEWIAANT